MKTGKEIELTTPGQIYAHVIKPVYNHVYRYVTFSTYSLP